MSRQTDVTTHPHVGGPPAGNDPRLPEGFLAALDNLPAGYSTGLFEGRRWGVTLRKNTDGRRIWLYAEELGDIGVISFNLYHFEDGRFVLKPCEMAREDILTFIVELQSDKVYNALI